MSNNIKLIVLLFLLCSSLFAGSPSDSPTVGNGMASDCTDGVKTSTMQLVHAFAPIAHIFGLIMLIMAINVLFLSDDKQGGGKMMPGTLYSIAAYLLLRIEQTVEWLMA